MTINERVKYFRKDYLKLNQTEFADKLGMTQTGVSYMEREGSTVTDQTIKTLCLLFNANEDWIRHGVEPMIVKPDVFSLDDFVKSNGMTDFELEIVKTYFELDPELRKMLIEHFRKGISNASVSNQSNDYYSDCPATPEELEKQFPPVENGVKHVG